MNKNKLVWFAAIGALALLAAASSPAFPMSQDTTTGEDQAAAEAEGKTGAAAVEEILRQQEQLLRGQRFSYEPEGRRDPFQSLFDVLKRSEGPRPAGVRGMGVEEIDLAGIVQDGAGENLAYFTGSDNQGYFLRVGDPVWDGTLIAIDAGRGAVTFRQKIDDPRQIKPYRDVVRRLVPLEENR